jgi:hypothetical protein
MDSLTGKQSHAAQLVAADEDSNDEIARKVGISVATLKRWKKDSAFQARVGAVITAIREQLQAQGIAKKQNRIDALVRREKLMEQLIAERAHDPRMRNVPGGTTGLLVAKPTLVKVFNADLDDEEIEDVADGSNPAGEMLAPAGLSQIVYEYAFDAALFREMRATEQQVAQEQGEWKQQHEHSGSLDLLTKLLQQPATVEIPAPPSDLADFES